MRTMVRGILLAALVLAGCGDDDRVGGGDAGSRDATTTGDGGGTATGQLAVHVVRVVDGEPADAAGAAVAFDDALGGRQEATAGADGRVTFDAIDWSAGPGTVVAWSEGHVLTSIGNLTDPGEELALSLLSLGSEPETVTLSGTVTGMTDAANSLIVTSTTGGFHQGIGPAWTMDVPTGEAGTLVAFELSVGDAAYERGDVYVLHQAATASFDAPAAAATADLDFGTPAALTEVTGTLPLPTSDRPSSVVNAGNLFLRVSGSDAGGALLGVATRMEEAAGAVEYDLGYVELAGVAEPTVAFFVSELPAQSAVFVDGWPAAGAQEVTFLDAPDVTEPAFGVDLAWGETIRWESADSETPAMVQVFDRDTGFLRAVAIVMPGRSSAALPRPPGATTVADVLAGSSVDARVAHCDNTGAPRPWMCQRFSRSRAFGVTP